MAECIHGFEEGLCDSCYPREAAVKADPESPTASPAVRRRATTATRRRSAKADKAAEPIAVAPLSTRRIYHATHISNLEAILSEGAILAGATPEVDIMAADLREQRSSIEVAPGATSSAFVPFSLSPHATWWNDVRSGAVEPRWSDQARRSQGTQYVVLVGTVAAVGDDVVVSDTDVASPLARFASGLNDGASLVARTVSRDPDLLEAEILVPGRYAMSDVVLLALPNEPVRDRVKTMLRSFTGKAPKLAVYPPWFQPTELDTD